MNKLEVYRFNPAAIFPVIVPNDTQLELHSNRFEVAFLCNVCLQHTCLLGVGMLLLLRHLHLTEKKKSYPKENDAVFEE